MKMSHIILVIAIVGICKAELEQWQSLAEELKTISYYTNFPSQSQSFVMFYYALFEKCKEASQVLDSVIPSFSGRNIRFYRLEGPANPRIIKENKEIEFLPTLAFIKAGTRSITETYKGKWNKEELQIWIKNITEGILGDPRDEACRGYYQVAEEMINIKIKFLGMKQKFEDLSQIASRNLKNNEKTLGETSGWLYEIILLILGGGVGFILCYFLYRKSIGIRKPTTV